MSLYPGANAYPTSYAEVDGTAKPTASAIGIGVEAIADRFASAKASIDAINVTDAALTARVVALEGHHANEVMHLVGSGRFVDDGAGGDPARQTWDHTSSSAFGVVYNLATITGAQAGDVVEILGVQGVEVYAPIGAAGDNEAELRLVSTESGPYVEEPGTRMRFRHMATELAAHYWRNVTIRAFHTMAATANLSIALDAKLTQITGTDDPELILYAPIFYRWLIWRPNT